MTCRSYRATAGTTAYGLFLGEQSLDSLTHTRGPLAQTGDSFSRTGVFGAESYGRRSTDQDTARSALGRRATDRMLVERSSIRVDVEKVDRLLNLVGELVIAQSMLADAAQRSGAANNAQLRDSVAYAGRQTRELQDAVMGIRLLPIEFLFSRMQRTVRDLAQRLGKEVELAPQGGETELDKEIIEKLADPLLHLVRNAVDHGIEPPELREAAGKRRRGTIQLRAMHQGGGILVEINDDGGGFDREKILSKAKERGLHVHPGMSDEQVWQLAFAPGFTTADEVSDISGRGMGMDVVKRNVQALGGNIDVRSRNGVGTAIAIRLPLTLAILEGMTVEIGGESFIIPLSLHRRGLPAAGRPGEVHRQRSAGDPDTRQLCAPAHARAPAARPRERRAARGRDHDRRRSRRPPRGAGRRSAARPATSGDQEPGGELPARSRHRRGDRPR